jgi:hypothetical protein
VEIQSENGHLYQPDDRPVLFPQQSPTRLRPLTSVREMSGEALGPRNPRRADEPSADAR